MKNLYIKETVIDKDEDVILHESPIYETYFTNTKDLYRGLLKEYGKCVSKMYIDTKDKETKQIGWVFQKKIKDTEGEYLQEAWVEVHDAPERIEYTYYYHKF